MDYTLNAKQLNKLITKLRERGYKKKDIAAILEVPAPVLSNLINTILPTLCSISPETSNPEEQVQFAFSQVNNMSSTKTLQALKTYVQKLQSAVNNKGNLSDEKGYFTLLRQQTRDSYQFVKDYYQGTYNLYYISSNYGCVKKEPFQIKANSIEKAIEIRKGNKKSAVQYKGIALANSKHSLNCQLVEDGSNPQENMSIILSLPFIHETNFLRGIILNLSYGRQPISRKIVLHKISSAQQPEAYQEIETRLFKKETPADIPEIHNYLYDKPSKIECFAIPNPQFNFTDLTSEIDLINKLKGNKG